MTFFKYSLLFSTILFLNSQDCWAMDNGDKEDVERFLKAPTGASKKKDVESFFKSPTDIRVNPSTLVTFYHEDETISRGLGPYGEKAVERMLKKYQLARNTNDIKIYITSKDNDNGFDFVVVDDPLKKIVFLEAKCTRAFPLLKDPKKYALAVSCAKKDNKVFSEVQNTLQRILKKLPKQQFFQLSRQWCASCSNNIKLLQSIDTKLKSSEPSMDNHLRGLIKDKGYKFMRVAALTISHEQKTKPLPTPTYYAIVGDGNSKEPISEDKEQKDRIVNAGLSFLLDNQELSLNEAQEYLYKISKKLKEYRYPIEIINGSEKIFPEGMLSLKKDKKRSASLTPKKSPIKKPKFDSIYNILQQFVKNRDYTKEKLEKNLKELSEAEGVRKFKKLSGLLYKVLIKEPLEEKLLKGVKLQFQKLNDPQTLNSTNLANKMNESMEKGDEFLKEFFKVSVLPLLPPKKRQEEKENLKLNVSGEEFHLIEKSVKFNVSGEEFHLIEEEVDSDGDCGYSALRTNRQDATQLLLNNIHREEIRQLITPEIYDMLPQLHKTHPIVLFQEYQINLEQQQILDNHYQKICTTLNDYFQRPETDRWDGDQLWQSCQQNLNGIQQDQQQKKSCEVFKTLREKIQQNEEERMQFCSQQETIECYIKNFMKIPVLDYYKQYGDNNWLNYSPNLMNDQKYRTYGINAIAQLLGKNLIILDENGGIKHQYQFSEAPIGKENTFFLRHIGNFHFNKLNPEKK